MSKHDYITQIEHKIDAHRQTIAALQREIDKLEGAAEVIAQLRGNDGIMALDVTPEKKSAPMFTIRKKIDGPTRKRAKYEPVKSADLKAGILEALTEPGGLKLADIADVMGFNRDDKKARNRIWYALDQMIKAGEADKDGNIYILPPPRRIAPEMYGADSG